MSGRQRALHDDIATHFETMRETPEIAASAIVKITENTCAAGIFVIHASEELGSRHFFATHPDDRMSAARTLSRSFWQ